MSNTTFSNSLARVTEALFIAGSKTYSIALISSVEVRRLAPDFRPAGLLAAFGVIFAFLGLVFWENAAKYDSLWVRMVVPAFFIIIGATFVASAINLWKNTRATFALFVTTAGGEVEALVDVNESTIRSVAEVLIRADEAKRDSASRRD